MAVYGLGTGTSKVAIVNTNKRAFLDGLRSADTPVSVSRFNQFWDLMETIKIHGYIKAAMSVIGRSAIGAWWGLVEHEEYGDRATERQRKRLMQFYLSPVKNWDNIKDFQNIAYKFMIGAMYLRYFGQAAFHIIRNELGQPIGFDHLPGYVVPNVDETGRFKSPSFIQYVSRDSRHRVEFSDPRDIIFIVNPDFEGFAGGGSDTSSLSNFALPIDIYLQTAARSYLQNRDKPEAFYLLSSDVSDDAFDAFVAALEAKYAGPTNVGRNPIAVKGDLDIKELDGLPSALPYQASRDDVREEVLAVSGTPGAKLGLTTAMASANLRETRREFHEATMIPLFRLIEIALWEQVHVREYGIYGWAFRFNNPDFLNAVEKATVHLRYKQMGALNSNEIRYDLGMKPRTDPAGDMFEDEMDFETPNPQGSPPEGRPLDPDSPSEVGEPNMEADDPLRGDQHDEQSRMLILQELRQWRTFQLKRVGKSMRQFKTNYIPDIISQTIAADLRSRTTPEQIKDYFQEAEQIIMGSLAEV